MTSTPTPQPPTPDSFGLLHPRDVMAGEYAAIYDFLEGALDDTSEEAAEEPREFLEAMLGEFITHAQGALARLRAS